MSCTDRHRFIAASDWCSEIEDAEQKGRSDASIFAVVNPGLLCDAEAEQGRQILSASTKARTSAVSKKRVSEWIFTLIGEIAVFATFLNESKVLQSVLNKR